MDIKVTSDSTIYNGDIIAGAPVITKLNVNDLEPGKIHRFMFKGADMNIGQSWYVPVLVAVGKKSGKKVLLNTGVHGDELNGSRVIHKIFETLDPANLNGVVMGVVQASPNSLLHISRNWHSSTDGGEMINMNRVYPGKVDGNSGEVHAYKLWNGLYLGNIDVVIDLHTQSTDTEYPLFIYADYTNPGVQHIAELVPADQIQVDEGGEVQGAVENAFNYINIPAITIEIGGPRQYQVEYINRAIDGINNILIDQKLIEGQIGQTAKEFGTFIARNSISVNATVGGYAEILVEIGNVVCKGQEVALQRNPFGDIIQRYTAPNAGVVSSIATGAIREHGGLLVRIIF